jgi:hypothetical protein
MYPFVEYLLLGLAVIAIIMGGLAISIVTRTRAAAQDLRQLDQYER